MHEAFLLFVLCVEMKHLQWILFLQLHRDFILPPEREGFILRMYDIIKKAESVMHQQPANTNRLSHVPASTLPEATVCFRDSVTVIENINWVLSLLIVFGFF